MDITIRQQQNTNESLAIGQQIWWLMDISVWGQYQYTYGEHLVRLQRNHKDIATNYVGVVFFLNTDM